MENKNELAVKPIHSLIIKFALPSIIAFLVSSLYNIVDQIFVGNYSGYLGNAATSIVFPIFIFGMAIASCISDGGVAYFSLQLGAGHKKIAEKIFGNVIS
ncbi:MAG: MATE family efflux transporter, partial [Alphaproteobacteria bacterium]|nr:MATE family efflux transporter [Alphaproteobacteria bacterium]